MGEMVRWSRFRFHRLERLSRLERVLEDAALALECSLDAGRGDRWVLFVCNDEELEPAVISRGFKTDLDGVLAAFGAAAGGRSDPWGLAAGGPVRELGRDACSRRDAFDVPRVGAEGVDGFDGVVD